MKRLGLCALLLAAASCRAHERVTCDSIKLSDELALDLGRRIWQNESGGTIDGLVFWSPKEPFPSMGISHFIWYPDGYEGKYEETFPKLLAYLARRGAVVPDWLRANPHCPWKTREEFLADAQSPRMKELRQLLVDTIPLQARWTADRLETVLPKILDSMPEDRRAAVRAQFYRVGCEPRGVYALIDYLNFKGDGTSAKERYHDQGWGLRQVLEGMGGTAPGQAAIEEFVMSAERVLSLRVKNAAEHGKDESAWLGNWMRRVRGYLAS